MGTTSVDQSRNAKSGCLASVLLADLYALECLGPLENSKQNAAPGAMNFPVPWRCLLPQEVLMQLM